MKKSGSAGRWVYLVLILVFLYAPIAVLILYSFNESRTMGNWTGFSLRWYEALLQDSSLMSALGVTLSIAVISAVVATVLGTAAAIGIQNMRKTPRRLVESVSQLPMVNPDLVTGISLMMLFVFLGIRNSYVRLLIAHITFNLPYVIFAVLPRLRKSSGQLYEAALDLGCRPIQAAMKVLIPEALPGIISGALLSFTMSIDDFIISYFVGGDVNNLSMEVFGSARRHVSPSMYALSAIMFLAVLALLIIINRRSSLEDV